MKTKARLTLEFSPEFRAGLQKMADEDRTNMTAVIRTAIAFYEVCRIAKKDGKHVGIVDDPTRLDREIVGLI